MNQSIFRLYDIRGKYPEEISESVVFAVAVRLGVLFDKNKKIIVGCDGRVSSPALYRAFCAGLDRAEIGYVPIGLATRPMMIFLTHYRRAGGAVLVTASHNPKEYNGLKISDERGRDISGIALYKKLYTWRTSSWERRFTDDAPIVQSDKLPYDAYVSFLIDRVALPRSIKVVVDCSNGATAPIVQRLKNRVHNLSLVLINNSVDGSFPAHGPDPTRVGALKQLSARVRKEHADFGVCFDGDGDRAVFVDNAGVPLRAGHMWRLLVGDSRVHTTVYTVASAYAIAQFAPTISRAALHVHRAAVGQVSIESTMRRVGADIGFEESGHYYFKDFFNADSGIFAMMRVAQAIARLPYDLKRFRLFLPPLLPALDFSMPMLRIRQRNLFFRISHAFGKEIHLIDRTDGMACAVRDGWFLVRISNTQDVVRVYVEGKTAARVRALAQRLARAIKIT
ncbi:MAG: hypothetical protein WC246_03725 [Candidatus Paceibacterota bacterium]|jgi:phosphomannomutase